MHRYLRRWFTALRVADPLDRQAALLLQILLLGMLLAVGLAMVLNVAVFGLGALTPAGLLPNLALLTMVGLALAVLRGGRFRATVTLLTTVLLLGQAFALFGEGLGRNPAQLLVFILPIALTGLLLGRRALLLTVGVSLALVLAAAAREANGGLNAAPPPPLGATLVIFGLVVGVLSLLLDRFSNTLRGALVSAQQLAAENARLYADAQQQRTQLQATLASVGESEARFRTMADSSPVLLWVTAPDGGCTFVNQPWLDYSGRGLDEALGNGWLDLIHFHDRERALSTLGAAFAARQPFSIDLRLHRHDGAHRWLVNTGVPRFTPDGSFAGYVGSCVDITDRIMAERRLAAQYEVARILADAPDPHSAIGAILRVISERLGWDWAAHWELDRAAGVLRCAQIWHTPELDATPLVQASRERAFVRGEELPGRVWASGVAIWTSDLRSDHEFARAEAALQSGLRSTFAVPIELGNSFLGVLEFARGSTYEPNEALLAILSSIGNQIGQLIERRQAEAALRQSESRNRTLVDAIPQITWVLDARGRMDYFNRRWYEYTGMVSSPHVQLHWIEALHPEEQEPLIRLRSAALESSQPYEMTVRIRRADGAYRWHLARVVPLYDHGQIVAWYGAATDIHDLKQAQDSQHFLSEAAAMLSSTLDETTILTRVADLAVPRLGDWCIVDMLQDDGAIRTVALAHTDPQMTAQGWEHVRRYPIDPAAAHGTAGVLRSGKPELAPDIPPAAVAQIISDPEQAASLLGLGFRSTLCVPLIASGRTLGVVALVSAQPGRYGHDDLLLAEELASRGALAVDNARLYAEAQKAITVRDQFLSIASHELKTPLTALLGFARLLLRRHQREGMLSERDALAVTTIAQQGARLEGLVNLLLDLSRIETGHLQIEAGPVDICALTRRLVEETRPSLERHTLTLECADEPLEVLGDSLRLEQVVQNLLQNAIKYSPSGGAVQVQITRVGEELRLSVRDQGIGIPTEALPQLFTRFYRAPNANPAHISGTGIGLYVVREIITRHGGSIAVESAPGIGSTFSVMIPLAAASDRVDEGQTHDYTCR